MTKNIIVYKVRLPWKIGVIFVDKDEKLISRIQSKIKIKLKWIFRHKRNNDVFLSNVYLFGYIRSFSFSNKLSTLIPSSFAIL